MSEYHVLIEKLSRITVARGATPGEEAVARQKIVVLREKIARQGELPPIDWEQYHPPSPQDLRDWERLLAIIIRASGGIPRRPGVSPQKPKNAG